MPRADSMRAEDRTRLLRPPPRGESFDDRIAASCLPHLGNSATQSQAASNSSGQTAPRIPQPLRAVLVAGYAALFAGRPTSRDFYLHLVRNAVAAVVRGRGPTAR